jgi:vacuolar-type H+-ATPase subunit E/Vma4
LIESIRREADREAAAVLVRARAEADRIDNEARAAWSEVRSRVIGERQSEWLREDEPALATARRNATREVLAARERLLDRVFQAVAAEFVDILRDPTYQATLKGLIDEALPFAGNRPATVICADMIAASVREAVAARGDVGVRTEANARGGVMVVADDGTVSIDNTLEGRLQRMKPQLAIELVEQVERYGDHGVG